MFKIIKRHRQTYNGEEIISRRTLTGGQWNTVAEHVRNRVTNNQISNRAVVFGNGQHRKTFDIGSVIKHKSGLLGQDTLQTYGCNAFYRDFTPDFMVVTNRIIAKEMVDSNFTKTNIVYTRVDIMLEFPKKFYLIPHDPYADAGATAMYLAAFDGHKRIYLLGFDGQDTRGVNNNVYAGTPGYQDQTSEVLDDKWIDNQAQVMNTYDDVDWVFVSETGRYQIPEKWKYITNLRSISYRDWVLEADL